MSRLLSWAFEASFILSALILLKLWVFPFFIHLWFQGVAPIPEWTMLIFAVVTCIVYIGLGSTAKHVYSLPWTGSVLGFVALHAPFFLNFPFIKGVSSAWQGLVSDGLSLFLPKHILSPFLLASIYAGLFILGRGVVVQEKEEGQTQEKGFIRQKR